MPFFILTPHKRTKGGIGMKIIEEEHLGDEWYLITLVDEFGIIYTATRDPQGNMSEPEIMV